MTHPRPWHLAGYSAGGGLHQTFLRDANNQIITGTRVYEYASDDIKDGTLLDDGLYRQELEGLRAMMNEVPQSE